MLLLPSHPTLYLLLLDQHGLMVHCPPLSPLFPFLFPFLFPSPYYYFPSLLLSMQMVRFIFEQYPDAIFRETVSQRFPNTSTKSQRAWSKQPLGSGPSTSTSSTTHVGSAPDPAVIDQVYLSTAESVRMRRGAAATINKRSFSTHGHGATGGGGAQAQEGGRGQVDGRGHVEGQGEGDGSFVTAISDAASSVVMSLQSVLGGGGGSALTNSAPVPAPGPTRRPSVGALGDGNSRSSSTSGSPRGGPAHDPPLQGILKTTKHTAQGSVVLDKEEAGGGQSTSTSGVGAESGVGASSLSTMLLMQQSRRAALGICDGCLPLHLAAINCHLSPGGAVSKFLLEKYPVGARLQVRE